MTLRVMSKIEEQGHKNWPRRLDDYVTGSIALAQETCIVCIRLQADRQRECNM